MKPAAIFATGLLLAIASLAHASSRRASPSVDWVSAAVVADHACRPQPARSDICITFDGSAGRHSDLLVMSGVQAIKAVQSDGFAGDLAAFARTQDDPTAIELWRGMAPEEVVLALQGALDGMSVTTYGGVRGWVLKTFWGNMAFDGGDGPVRLNRYALPRSEGSIANTLVHEAAHRIGLTHPSSDTDLASARCEPPYVIGSLIEKQVVGAAWRADGSDCPTLVLALSNPSSGNG